MKNITINEVTPILIRAELLYQKDYSSLPISESDEIKEQLTAMKLFMSELTHMIQKGLELDNDFALSKMKIIEEYLDELEGYSDDNDNDNDNTNSYGSYTVHQD